VETDVISIPTPRYSFGFLDFGQNTILDLFTAGTNEYAASRALEQEAVFSKKKSYICCIFALKNFKFIRFFATKNL
jgi:hypothetical protein